MTRDDESGRATRGPAGTCAKRYHRRVRRLVLWLSLLLLLGCGRRQHESPWSPVRASHAADETPSWSDGDIVRANVLGSADALVALFVALWLPAGTVLVVAGALWRAHRRRASQEASSIADGPLVDGPAVVQGTVETDGGPAIVVAVTQRRITHKDKQGREHARWTELRREVVASPFRVRLRDGRVVRVEPTRSVLLRDAIEAPEPVDEATRRRCIRLRAGEHAWVSGVLSGAGPRGTRSAYREGAPPAVLRSPRLSRMVVSTEPPGAYHAERESYHRGYFKGLLVALAVVHVLVLWDVALQTLSGRGVTLLIERTSTWDTWTKPKNQAGHFVRHCGVSGRAIPGDAPEEHEVSCAFHACAVRGACRTLPTRRALLTADLMREPGRAPTVHEVQVFLAGIVGWVALVAYWIAARAALPWYAGGKVNDG